MPPERVLIIDDDDTLALAMQVRLRAAAFDPVRADRGREGLEIARADPPACIVLDLRMPGMDGYEVLQELKGDSRTETIPVVVVSANVQDESRRRVLDGGAARFVGKPYDAAYLIRTIRDVVAGRTTEAGTDGRDGQCKAVAG